MLSERTSSCLMNVLIAIFKWVRLIHRTLGSTRRFVETRHVASLQNLRSHASANRYKSLMRTSNWVAREVALLSPHTLLLPRGS